VAENFRKVVDFVQRGGLPERPAVVSSVINGLVATGQLSGNWGLPAAAANIVQKSTETAANVVKQAKFEEALADKAANRPVVQTVRQHRDGDTHLYVDAVDEGSVARLLHRNSDVIGKIVRDKVKGGGVPRTSR